MTDTKDNNSNDDNAQNGFDIKNLKNMVTIGGGVFVFGFLALVGVLIWKLATMPASGTAGLEALGETSAFTLPKGVRLVSANVVGSTATVTSQGPNGNVSIQVIDLTKSKTVHTIVVQRAK